MRKVLPVVLALTWFSLAALAGAYAADAKAGTLTCVGLYSETSDGSVSYKVGSGDWVVVKVGDVIPASAPALTSACAQGTPPKAVATAAESPR